MYSAFVIQLYGEKELDELTYRRVFEILEEILTIFGLDYQESGAFYDEFIQFCKELLQEGKITIQGQKEIKAKLYSLYKRRLTFPQSNLQQVYQEFKQEAQKWGFEREAVQKRYEETQKGMKNFKVHHTIFQKAMSLYQNNLKRDKELVSFFKHNFSSIHKNNANYVKLYYERALNVNPMNVEIWDLYIKEVEMLVKQFRGLKEQVYQKAIKANPNLSQYWLRFMLHHQ